MVKPTYFIWWYRPEACDWKNKKNGLEIWYLLASHKWCDWTRFEESHQHFSMEGSSWVILTIYEHPTRPRTHSKVIGGWVVDGWMCSKEILEFLLGPNLEAWTEMNNLIKEILKPIEIVKICYKVAALCSCCTSCYCQAQFKSSSSSVQLRTETGPYNQCETHPPTPPHPGKYIWAPSRPPWKLKFGMEAVLTKLSQLAN